MAKRVLIAFDKFKEALTAPEACAIAAAEIARLHPTWSIDVCPLSDGGDGFCTILTAAAGGETRWFPAPGPRGESRTAPIGLVHAVQMPHAARGLLTRPGGASTPKLVAVVEMAAIDGLALLAPTQRDLWSTCTTGTGHLLRAAAEAGADLIVLGIGGSATHDLGLGALGVLGLRFHDASGAVIDPPVPSRWELIEALSGDLTTDLPPIVVASDVRHPLLGPSGAAASFGPQKGLHPADLARLEAATQGMATMLCAHFGCDFATESNRPGAGASGGLGFGLSVATGARFLPGSDFVFAWLDIEARVRRADFVITGEGRWDAASVAGKGPGAIVQRAQAHGRRAIVLAGSLEGEIAPTNDMHEITPTGTPLGKALAMTRENLAAGVRHVFSSIPLDPPPRSWLRGG